MKATDRLVMMVIGFVPDVALAWGFMKLSDGDSSEFWTALLVLFGVQAFFGIKNALRGSLLYRLYGRRKMLEMVKTFLQTNKCPDAERDESAEEYFYRISYGDEYPVSMRLLAMSEYAGIQAHKARSFLYALRLTSAYDEAVRNYHGRFRPSEASIIY